MKTVPTRICSALCFLFMTVLALQAAEKYKIEDFSLDLNSSLAPANHLWVMSGWSSVTPVSQTVTGVGECIGAPLAGKGFKLNVIFEANDHLIPDNGNYGKGDVGLLYSGGIWQPDKIIRNGTYHHLIDNKLISFSVTSELIPMFNRTGFILKCTIINRSESLLKLKVIPGLTPGNPNYIPLNSWVYSTPPAGEEALAENENVWSNNNVRIALFSESLISDIPAGESSETYIAVIFSDKKTSIQEPVRIKEWEMEEREAWEKRLKWALKDVPVIESSIPGLDDFYKRSLVSGLVTIWENPSFAVNPFVTTCGIDGGGMCTYLWDFAGYVAGMTNLMLGDRVFPIAKAMSSIGLDKYYAFTLDGTGIGVSYAYSTWSFVNLTWEIAKNRGVNTGLFNEARRLVLNDEKKESANILIDYGLQHNLLEMRGEGWEHFVASPNAERAWCLERLADMGEKIKSDPVEIKQWKEKSVIIKKAVRDQLWDTVSHWFRSVYPDGHSELVYSVQVYDALKAGVCSEEMTGYLLDHLKDGLFLFPYGISSVSAEDKIHFEVNDPDWSGGGSFTGEGPDLAHYLYNIGKSDLAFDILGRNFWMGKHLPYFPQEHYVTKPAVPAHKRANELSGLAGAEAILFGMAGFDPRIDGSLWINPHFPSDSAISLTGYGWKDNKIDLKLNHNLLVITLNGKQIYSGIQKLVRIN